MRRKKSKSQLFIKLRYNTISRFNRLTGSTFNKYDIDRDVKFCDIDKFDTRMETFWDAIKKINSYISVRDKDYVTWRYCDPRGGKYFIKQAEKEGEVLRYCVFRINRYEEDYPTGYIVDLMTLSDKLDIIDVLVHDPISFFNEDNVNIIKSWNSNNDIFSKFLI